MFIRGSVVRYVHLPGAAVDTALLEDATRRGKWKLTGQNDRQWLIVFRVIEAAQQASKAR